MYTIHMSQPFCSPMHHHCSLPLLRASTEGPVRSHLGISLRLAGSSGIDLCNPQAGARHGTVSADAETTAFMVRVCQVTAYQIHADSELLNICVDILSPDAMGACNLCV